MKYGKIYAAPIGMIKNTVAGHEPEEERGGNALVAVAERVVWGDEIQQHGGHGVLVGGV